MKMIAFENGDWVPEEELLFRKVGLELPHEVLRGEWKLKRRDFVRFTGFGTVHMFLPWNPSGAT